MSRANLKAIYLLIVFLIKDKPKPIRRLNKGPAIHPARPISPYPALASAIFMERSGAELPNDNKVIPRNDGLTLNSIPIVFSKSTSTLAVIHIQNIDIINETTQIV